MSKKLPLAVVPKPKKFLRKAYLLATLNTPLVTFSHPLDNNSVPTSLSTYKVNQSQRTSNGVLQASLCGCGRQPCGYVSKRGDEHTSR